MSFEQAAFHGLPAVRLAGAGGASAIVTLQGAQVVSWIPAGGTEQLFVSERSDFAAGRALRGGIPVVFPQFSQRGPLPKHGLARARTWAPARSDATADGVTATFALQDSSQTRAAWPHAFALELTVAVAGASLEVRLQVLNAGEAPFSFTAALHTYLFVSDATKARLLGLPGEPIVPANPIDTVYADAPRETRLVDGGRLLTISQRNFRDTVVWNPGPEESRSLKDMTATGFLNMLCVEAAAVEVPVVLVPGGRWSGSQELVSGRFE